MEEKQSRYLKYKESINRAVQKYRANPENKEKIRESKKKRRQFLYECEKKIKELEIKSN